MEPTTTLVRPSDKGLSGAAIKYINRRFVDPKSEANSNRLGLWAECQPKHFQTYPTQGSGTA